MTRYAEHVGEAWAEWWSGEAAVAAGLLYARDVVWWDTTRGRGHETRGRDALAAEHRDRFVADRFGVTVRRVVDGGDTVAVEFVAVARECGTLVAAPACAFWRLDDDGRIEREEWFWTWDARAPADPSMAGHDARGGDGTRDAGWYRRFAAGLLAAWDASPPGMVDEYYADDVVFDTMGGGPDRVFRGAGALRAAEEALEVALPERASRVGMVCGEGPVVAFTHFTQARTANGPRRTTPAARVLTLDEHDRVVGDHTYLVRAWPARGGR